MYPFIRRVCYRQILKPWMINSMMWLKTSDIFAMGEKSISMLGWYSDLRFYGLEKPICIRWIGR